MCCTASAEAAAAQLAMAGIPHCQQQALGDPSFDCWMNMNVSVPEEREERRLEFGILAETATKFRFLQLFSSFSFGSSSVCLPASLRLLLVQSGLT
jgi:hypothetical protein